MRIENFIEKRNCLFNESVLVVWCTCTSRIPFTDSIQFTFETFTSALWQSWGWVVHWSDVIVSLVTFVNCVCIFLSQYLYQSIHPSAVCPPAHPSVCLSNNLSQWHSQMWMSAQLAWTNATFWPHAQIFRVPTIAHATEATQGMEQYALVSNASYSNSSERLFGSADACT